MLEKKEETGGTCRCALPTLADREEEKGENCRAHQPSPCAYGPEKRGGRGTGCAGRERREGVESCSLFLC